MARVYGEDMKQAANLYTGAVRVKKAEHDDLIAELTEAHDILRGWGDRIAATPGDDARFLLKAIDTATDAATRAIIDARVALHLPEQQ